MTELTEASLEAVQCLSCDNAHFHIFSADAGFMTRRLSTDALGDNPTVSPPVLVHGYGKPAKDDLARLGQLTHWAPGMLCA